VSGLSKSPLKRDFTKNEKNKEKIRKRTSKNVDAKQHDKSVKNETSSSEPKFVILQRPKDSQGTTTV
jgi:hypothetical protein